MKNELIFIKHIEDSIKDLESFVKEMSKKDFLKNKIIQSAVIRQIEVIGEATKNISDNFKKKYPKIEWKIISGMRDKLIHHYFGVDLEQVWLVVKKDIPVLKKEINFILKKEIK